MSDKNQLTLNHDASCSYSEQLTANLVGTCRTEELNGVKYLVAKIAALNPGVLNGSRGPLLYTPEDTRKATKSWNDVPLVVYHPTDNNGLPISAKTDGVVHVGFTKNANYNGKLSVEGWFDIEKTKTTDSRVYDALVNGTPMEVSTGLGTTNEEAPAGASYLGQLYSHIARNHKPDHLAILPDQRGACSLNDGCGLHVNQQTEDVENCGGKGGTPGPCPMGEKEKKAVTSLAHKRGYHVMKINEKQFKLYKPGDSKDADAGKEHGPFTHESAHQFLTRNAEELCTNCDASGECEECKAKRLKKTTELNSEEEPVENTENCGGEGGKPGPCPGSSESVLSLEEAGKKLDLANAFWQAESQQPRRTKADKQRMLDASRAVRDAEKAYEQAYKRKTGQTTNELSHDDLRTKLNSNDQREFLKTLNCGGEGGKPGPCPTKSKVAEHDDTVMKMVGSGMSITEATKHANKIHGQRSTLARQDEQANLTSKEKQKELSDSLRWKRNLSDFNAGYSNELTRISRKMSNNQLSSSRSGLLSLVANGDTYQGVPIMAGKLSDADRQKLVDGLITNSGFEIADIYSEEDTEVLNAMSDEKLFKAALAKQTLIDQQTVVNQVSQITGERNVENMADAIQNAFKPFKKKAKDEEDDEDMEDEDEGETTNSDIRVPRQMTEAEFMKMAPPSIRADLEFSRATQNKEKQELIGSITDNVSGDDLDQVVNYLRTKPLPELRIIANMTSKPAAPEFDVNIRRSVNYGGMAVPTGNRPTTNKRPGEGPKPVVINWAELSKNNAG